MNPGSGARMSLPAWARSEIARQLLAAIVEAPPELHVNSGRLPRIYGSHREPTEPTYTGPIAGRLRRIRKEWIEREYDLLNRQFAATHHWDADSAERILRAETVEAVIGRVLAEAGARKEAA